MDERRTDRLRVTIRPGGPILVPGPVEVVLPDGEVAVSDRPMVAICVCRRSQIYPFCDTSHRARSRVVDQDGSGACSDD